MNTNVKKLEQLISELKDFYEANCVKKSCEKEKCMALDEQEIALIHLCIDILGNEHIYDISNYTIKELFIVHKDEDLCQKICDKNHTQNEALKYKRISQTSDISLDQMTELLLVYYIATLLCANDENTIGGAEIKRSYACVYAYFACICLKTFRTLFLNQIYIFMSKTHNQASFNDIRKNLEYEEELLAAYAELMEDKGRMKAKREITNRFWEIMKYDKAIKSLIKIEDLRMPGFIAFDYNGGDTVEGPSYVGILEGIEYLLCYLKYLEKNIDDGTFDGNKLKDAIGNVRQNAIRLRNVFELLAAEANVNVSVFEQKFENINMLLESFKKHFDNNYIKLIEV